jgi:hypothetical protein
MRYALCALDTEQAGQWPVQYRILFDNKLGTKHVKQSLSCTEGDAHENCTILAVGGGCWTRRHYVHSSAGNRAGASGVFLIRGVEANGREQNKKVDTSAFGGGKKTLGGGQRQIHRLPEAAHRATQSEAAIAASTRAFPARLHDPEALAEWPRGPSLKPGGSLRE